LQPLSYVVLLYQALMCGLAIMRPDNPYEFIVTKLRLLNEIGLDNLKWCVFFICRRTISVELFQIAWMTSKYECVCIEYSIAVN